ncbi:MAG: hypothetical protein ABWX67_15515 [Allosphingosinicella sp.]
MKSIALAATLLFSAVMPLSTAVAAPAPVAAQQSYVEYVGSFTTRDGVTYDVFYVEDLGDGWY